MFLRAAVTPAWPIEPLAAGGTHGGDRIRRACSGCEPGHPCPECEEEERIRPKLAVSQPGDPEEQEADRVADAVMRTANDQPSIATPGSGPSAGTEDRELPALRSPAVPNAPPSPSFAVPPRGTGRSLNAGARAFFEPRFGRDLGAVRIHDDPAAADSARRMQARAYTYGNQVVFGAGQYAPDHEAGRRLLAHELTHVLQNDGGAARVSRTPEDVARLNALPFSAHSSRPHFSAAFQTLYSEAILGLPDFEARINTACGEAGEALGLDTPHEAAIAAAAVDMAALVNGIDVGGAWEEFDLVGGLKKLHELLPSDTSDIQVTNFGFEYIYWRLVSHSSDFVALVLQERTHGAEIEADPDLSAVAGDSNAAFVQLDQDLSRIASALGDGKSLLMLELEGLVSTLVDLRNQSGSTDEEKQQNYSMRSELSRRALLINKKLMQMTDDATAPTPLDATVAAQLSKIRSTARSEEDTRSELGDPKSLLAAQPLNMAERVDDQFFMESGLSEEPEGARVEPQVAFPKTTDRFMTNTQAALASRINSQSDALTGQLNLIVPPHEESKYTLQEFARVYRHWFSVFGIEKEKAVMHQAGVMTLWEGIHGATAIGTLSVSGDVMTAWLRYETMKQTLPLLGLFVSTSVDTEFGTEIGRQRLQRMQRLSGKRASEAGYEFAQLYNAQELSGEGEAASRQAVAAERAKTTSERFTAAASMPYGLHSPVAYKLGVTPEPLPVLGMRRVEAKEGWNYLVAVPDYLSGETIAYEHKTATPEIAEYLLAQRQLATTLGAEHSISVNVPSPGRDRNTIQSRHVGPTPALEGGQTSQTASLNRADRQARKTISMPARDSGARAPSGIALLEGAMRDYLNYFFADAEAALRIAAIIHIMDVEHGIGKVFDKMLEPGEIAKVLAKAFGIGYGLGVLSSFGPIGKVLSLGIGKAMKVAGGSDLTSALTVAGFLKEAAEVPDFITARMMGYVGVPIVQDIKQLFEAALSAPAAAAGGKAADATVKAVLDRINQRPPATVAEAADLARQLAHASPEAREDMLAAVDTYIAEMEAQGVGTSHSRQDYDMMIAFRNAFHQESSQHQALDPFATKLEPKAPEGMQSPFEGPAFRPKTPGERAKLLGAMGDLAGKVQLFQDPTLHGADAATVRVYYDHGRVRIHHGSDATARDIELHMPTVRTLRKYEGFSGSIRILLQRAIHLLGFTASPLYGSKGFEAEQEITKLTAIRDDLIAQQEAIDLNARRFIDKEIESAIIDRHISNIDKQILQHMRDLDSLEAGRGFIEAQQPSKGIVRAAALGMGDPKPGHYWAERDGLLILVQRDPKADGYFVNQDILKAEVAKGKAGNPRSAIRPAAENVAAGALKAKSMGLGTPPQGHTWRQDASGALRLVRTDPKAPHFWFDNDGYEKAKAAGEADASKFIRPISEKADSDSDSARFDANTWAEAYAELGGDGTSTSFGKFRKVIGDLGVDPVTIIDRMQETGGGASRGESPSGRTIKSIRHSTKQHFIGTVVMPHLTDPASLADSPRYQAMIEAGKTPREAQIAASHERLLAITRQLDSADIGSLGEKWYGHWFAAEGDRPQFGVSKADIAARYTGTDLGQDRNIDLLRLVGDTEADLYEIKNVSSGFGPREIGEMDAHIALQGKKIPVPAPGGAAPVNRAIRRVVWVILNPDFLATNANVVFMTNRLKKHEFLEFHVYDESGNMVKVTFANHETVLGGLVTAARTAAAAR